MSNRFAPDSVKLNRIIDELVAEGAESLLTSAFSSVSDPSLESDSADELKNHLRTQLIVGKRIPWVFYDAIAELLRRSHRSLEGYIVEKLRIKTGSSGEYPGCESLRITLDGRWQVSWETDPAAEQAEDREVALDWYAPPGIDAAPIVPDHIVDYVGGCVTLLREGLTLPAAAILLVAFESALWDGLALTAEGSRLSECIEYEPVIWTAKRLANCLVVEPEGADRQLSDIDEETGAYRKVFDLTVRRMQSKSSAQEVNLQCSVDASIAEFLSSSCEISREEHADRGLRNAIEKGRSVELECLSPLPTQLDGTLIALRNNLAHLPFEHDLDPAVPVPDGGELRTVEELRETRLITNLLPWTVEVINSAYAPSLRLGDSGTEDER